MGDDQRYVWFVVTAEVTPVVIGRTVTLQTQASDGTVEAECVFRVRSPATFFGGMGTRL